MLKHFTEKFLRRHSRVSFDHESTLLFAAPQFLPKVSFNLSQLAILRQTSEAESLVLYWETGGKPRLLRWTAGQLGRGHCLTFTGALHFLRSCPTDNDPLEFIFGDLVDDLEPAEVKTITALAYFTLPATTSHLAPIAELPDEETDRALRKLTNRSLAVPNEELRAFILVPMVAAFWRKKKPAVMLETGNRLEKHAYAIIIENGYQKHNRFPVLEAAWAGVAPALPLFLAGDNQRFPTICEALDNFLFFQGHWDEWLALNKRVEARALASADFLNAGWRAHRSGHVHWLRGQAEEVLACADLVDSHWRTANAGAYERSASMLLPGCGNLLKGDYTAARECYQKAIELIRSLDPKSNNLATCLNELAGLESTTGDLVAAEGHYPEALPHARRAVEIFTRLGVSALESAQATLRECEAAVQK